MKPLFALLSILIILSSCSDSEESIIETDGVYVEINNDLRTLSLVDEENYDIELSSSAWLLISDQGEYMGNVGTIFELTLHDQGRNYIGGIGGITSCEGISVYILIVDDVITTGSTLEACIIEANKAKNIIVSVASIAIASGG